MGVWFCVTEVRSGRRERRLRTGLYFFEWIPVTDIQSFVGISFKNNENQKAGEYAWNRQVPWRRFDFCEEKTMVFLYVLEEGVTNFARKCLVHKVVGEPRILGILNKICQPSPATLKNY